MLKLKNKHFISELDQFLIAFDQKAAKLSDSQAKELAKHQRVSALRDQSQDNIATQKIWGKF